MLEGVKTDLIRGKGYEILSYLAGFAALALRPSVRGAIDVEDWLADVIGRPGNLTKLQEKDLVEIGEGFCRLTKLGSMVLAGGRDPVTAWDRQWDRQWRLLTFDIPRDAGRARVQFWRWLRQNHFGRLQGSVWITPDPLPPIEGAARQAGLDPTQMIVFTGQASPDLPSGELVSRAWDLASINAAYGDYLEFTRRVPKRMSTALQTREALKQDRILWRRAVRHDPLLPKELHPAGYAGLRAWKARQEFHQRMIRASDPPAPK